MIKSTNADVSDSPKYGVILECSDVELADEFEDFLTENCFVLFQTKIEQNSVSFFFGQASSVQKVRELYERFTTTITDE